MELSSKLHIMLATLFFLSSGQTVINGMIMIYPPGIAPACLGDQLELMCTNTGRVLEWKFTLGEINFSRLVSITSVSSNLNVSGTVFTFSRHSIPNSLPLISNLLISPVSNYLNRTVVNCVDRETSNLTSTTIKIINEYHFQDSQINITSMTEEFESDGVVVTLEWVQQNFYSYNIGVVPQLEYTVNEVTRVQLNVSYNTFYNLSIIASPPCGQNSTNKFIGLHYFSCRSQAYWTGIPSIEVIGLGNPSIEGTTITFNCPPGQMLIGNNTSVCMPNGEWEPDPQALECKAVIPTESSGLQNTMIIIVILATMCVLCSVVFFIGGFLCRHYCPKLKQCIKLEATPPQEKTHSTHINIQENVAYVNVSVQNQ